MNPFINFGKFMLISIFAEFVSVIMIGKIYLDYSQRQNLVAAILIFIAFKKKYIVFSKKDYKQNIISLIFIFYAILFLYVVFNVMGLLCMNYF